MDIDIPEADELEWLEKANSMLDEDYLLQEHDDYEEEDEGDHNQMHPFSSAGESASAPPKNRPSDHHTGNRKRPRSDARIVVEEDEQPSSSKQRSSGKVSLETSRDDDVVLIQSPPPQSNAGSETAALEDDAPEVFLSRYAWEIDGDCMPVTAPGGERVYAKVTKAAADKKATPANKFNVPSRCGGLISRPINTLLQRVEQDAFMKVLQATSEVPKYAIRSEALVTNEHLWVDKYAPKSFTELLSDEHTNREVLLWLKQWDATVFRCQVRSTSEEVLSALRRYSSAPYHKKHSDTHFVRKSKGFISSVNNSGFSTASDQETVGPKDTFGLQNRKPRDISSPEHKVLLLCGPPGLGKTTLAHVAAAHCGYRVVEINASDDRSSSTIQKKILDAVQMNSVLADSKPKCLVIDEIDGALGDGKGAVEIILKMVASGKSSEVGTSTKEHFPEKKSSRKGQKVVPITRPVICICNDLYAPALRPLLQVAKVHTFTQPTIIRIVSRLKYICNKEGLHASSVALTALAEFTECDIRSCLNTLQFLHMNKEPLNVLDISSQVVGRKDTTRNLFDIWKEVFQKRKTRKHRKTEACGTAISDSLDSLYFLVSNRGDYEVMFDGIHENCLQLHYHDPMMHKTVQCLDALGVSDLMHHCIMQSHNTPLYVHLPSMAITIHHLLGQVRKPAIEWPRSSQRCRSKLTAKRETFRSWSSRIAPYISRHLSLKSSIEDTLSLFLHILSPPSLRPIAYQLLSEREKIDLSQLVSTMIAYSISYKSTGSNSVMNTTSFGGTTDIPSLSFDPPIEAFTIFEGYRLTRVDLSLALKQVVLQEIEKQKILHGSKEKDHVHQAENCPRKNAATCTNNRFEEIRNDPHVLNQRCSIYVDPLNLSSSTSTATVPNLKLTGGIKKSANGSFCFFDRFKRLGSKNAQIGRRDMKKPLTLERDSRPVLFKFNEGFTNAVRRPVRMHEFLI